MGTLSHYGANLSLLTDLYQLTMGYGYWKQQMHEHQAVFHLTFRKCPFGGQMAIAAGAEAAVEYLEQLAFDSSDADYLRTLTGNDGERLFDDGYVEYLASLRFSCDVDVIPEGTAVFPHEPLIRVRGPLIQAQLVETPLLTMVNFQTLVATKAARVCRAAGDGAVLEFGLRRAQGIDGGLSASRAAYIGGCDATSNVLAGKLFGIPVKGTHAHSWVMAFDDELESFRAYAEAMPNNSLFLVDTYDTLEGVRKATVVGRELQERGHRMLGIRLDSGDLGQLSRGARKILDDAGFTDAAIVASNDLDEFAIEKLRAEGSAIAVWGVGTKLATCFDQPALGGVYKLAAVRADDSEPWRPSVKLSETPIKVSNPTAQQVRRFYNEDGMMTGDMIYSEASPPAQDNPESHDIILGDGEQRQLAGADASHEDLLVPALRDGRRVRAADPLHDVRARCKSQLAKLPASALSLQAAETYPVGLAPSLHQLKHELIAAARSES